MSLYDKIVLEVEEDNSPPQQFFPCPHCGGNFSELEGYLCRSCEDLQRDWYGDNLSDQA